MQHAARKGSWIIHAACFGRTYCGWPTDGPRWDLLTSHGSLHSVTCRNCVRKLVADGDLPPAVA